MHTPTKILFIASYPPRECGIATYSEDLIKALLNKFDNSLSIKVCALESGDVSYKYPEEVIMTLNSLKAKSYEKVAQNINLDRDTKLVLIQHEFGFFAKQEKAFRTFLSTINKPIVIVFHTVLPKPDKALHDNIKAIAAACTSIIVMTYASAQILAKEYDINPEKISVIAHGTHLVPHLGKHFLKKKYGFSGRKILTTFGLLSSGKSIETTLEAMPYIIKQCPEALFIAMGKTHPEVKKHEGEIYRESLEKMVIEKGLENHVIFINRYVALPELLEYLQMTDIYLFTSTDPNQAVSGTFVYAMSCACPIISTPIPHAKEILSENTDLLFDFRDARQLSVSVLRLLRNEPLRKNISSNTLQKIVFTAWENSAVAHAMLFEKIGGDSMTVHYNHPAIKLEHLQKMTTEKGIIQFSKINQPDISTGYTLDDNARAMIASCMYYQHSKDKNCLPEIKKYLRFIGFCLQTEGNFLNYVDKELLFTNQNQETNLDDSNGRAIWALGYLISQQAILPVKLITEAEAIFDKTLVHLQSVHSPRSMAFAIKGLYLYQNLKPTAEKDDLLITFAHRLAQMYKHEAEANWLWFESYLTYANSILPEAMLYAWLYTNEIVYKEIAVESVDFLCSKIFNEHGIEVISNREWMQKGEEKKPYGEQPIDVAYTILTLDKFNELFHNKAYRDKMHTAFNWFLGNNRLHQIIYNPCTGGCYDGLEENNVNLNQGAESTVSYLMARLTMEKLKTKN